jgi:hypothetical protein
MPNRTASIPVMLIMFFAATAIAQERPFLYILSPHHPAGPAFSLHYDAAYGKETFEPLGADRFEQVVGLRARVSDVVSISGRFGLASSSSSATTAQQVEVFANALDAGAWVVDVTGGAGFRREYSGTTVLLGRLIVGRQFEAWQLYGNVLLEKPLTADRDRIDLFIAAGWAVSVSESMRLGLEAVGQDLEGFWDDKEAEGGAVVYLGPTLSAHIPSSAMTITLGAGPILRATQSDRRNPAPRDLTTSDKNGFVVRAAVAVGL